MWARGWVGVWRVWGRDCGCGCGGVTVGVFHSVCFIHMRTIIELIPNSLDD